MDPSFSCWVAEFAEWLQKQKGLEFPVRPPLSFSDLAREFAVERRQDHMYRNFWFVEDGDRLVVKAVSIEFNVQVSNTAAAGYALEFMDNWQAYVKELNADAAGTADEAFHTSDLWVRAEAEEAIKGSTITTMAISCACGFLGALFFTGEWCMAFCVLGSTIMIMTCQLFFMTGIMGWEIGPIEVISLVVFVGYATTFNVHVAHAYKHAKGEDRFEMIGSALKMMGAAILAASATTLVSSVFLFFCTITIFVKFGGVIFAVTVFSALYSLLFMPSVLVFFDPSSGCCFPQALLRFRGGTSAVEPLVPGRPEEGAFSPGDAYKPASPTRPTIDESR